MQRAFSSKNNLIGKKIIRLKKTASTNDFCINLISKNEEEGTVVIADEQTSGRGRFKRQWHSLNKDGLYFSVLLKPDKNLNHSFLALCSGLAVANSIKKLFKLNAKIKWPNDVLINSKKLCGILVEKKKDWIIIGIGINVNNKYSSFPVELRNKATSIFIETGQRANKQILFSKVLEDFKKIYFYYLNKKNGILIRKIISMSDTMGKNIKIKNGNYFYEGEAAGIDESGALILKLKNDKIIKIYSGEIVDGYSGN